MGGDSDGYILTRYADIARVVRDPARFKPTMTFGIEAAERSLLEAEKRGAEPELPPELNAMVASMATLRPTQELYRAHKQELTDPWVGPGCEASRGDDH